MASADTLRPPQHHQQFDFIGRPDTQDERLLKFREALRRLEPLVSIDKVKAHTLLVSAFRVELDRVEEFLDHVNPTDVLRAYLSRGVYRFELWLKQVVGDVKSMEERKLSPVEIPPIDVLMVWHAYMLRPHRIFEAGVTDHLQLRALGAFPLQDVVALIDPISFDYTATDPQKTLWEQKTAVPFNPDRYKSVVRDKEVVCPYCSNTFLHPWENNGSGYGEFAFSASCQFCSEKITHERLCTSIFLEEVHAVQMSDRAIISGTLLDNQGNVAWSRARLIGLEVVKAVMNEDGSLPSLKDVSLENLANRICDSKASKLRKDRIMYLFRPFTQPSVFRQDLARAVFLHRQLPIDIKNCGWCDAKYLDGPCAEIRDAYERYLVFLEMAVYPERGRIVPTYDVDFIWHTNQLDGPQYREMVIQLFGVYLDHMSMEEDLNAHASAVELSIERLKEVFSKRFTNPGPLLLKSCSKCGGRGCSTCKCGPSMTQDFLLDDCLESDG